MIIWIASYPKSGNTWLRALISSYLYSQNGKFNFDLIRKIPRYVSNKNFAPFVDLEDLKKTPLKIANYWNVSQSRLNLDNKIKFLKTHNACITYENKNFLNELNTKSYIYIVRDPRAIVTSYADYSNISLEKSVSSLLNENEIGYNGKYNLAETPGSWKINYLSWKKEKAFKGIIVKYEDLLDDTEKEFKKILFFLKNFITITIDNKKLSECINSCQFSNLKKMELTKGFEEAKEGNFFRIGQKDSWKNRLSDNLKNKIERNFKNEMEELGYI